ncbi:MAG: hypothetical protein IKF52_06950 [Clostridia bacterium]|nr:hypothetical protein [Clostridia bacterium]
MIANDGVYIEPTFYTEVIRNNGKRLLKTKQKKKKVISKETAFILKDLLTQPVLGSNGTATYCDIDGVDVAAKTGTTDENYDRWLCGFTPYYTAATWFGFDQNETIHFGNRNPAGLIWANVMNRIHSGLPSEEFEKPQKVEAVTICAETGKIATTGCPHTYTDYFLKGTVPGLCDKHDGNEITYTKERTTNSGTIQGSETEIDEEEPPRVYTPPPDPTEKTNTNYLEPKITPKPSEIPTPKQNEKSETTEESEEIETEPETPTETPTPSPEEQTEETLTENDVSDVPVSSNQP